MNNHKNEFADNYNSNKEDKNVLHLDNNANNCENANDENIINIKFEKLNPLDTEKYKDNKSR